MTLKPQQSYDEVCRDSNATPADRENALLAEYAIALRKIETVEKAAKLEALRYALNLVQGRRVLRRTDSYLAAIDELEIFLLASIERVERGEEMYSVAYTQSETES